MFLECVLATFIPVCSSYVSLLGSSASGLSDTTKNACLLQELFVEVAILIKTVLINLNPDAIKTDGI